MQSSFISYNIIQFKLLCVTFWSASESPDNMRFRLVSEFFWAVIALTLQLLFERECDSDIMLFSMLERAFNFEVNWSWIKLENNKAKENSLKEEN